MKQNRAEETNAIDPFDLLTLNERKLLNDRTIQFPFTIRAENFNFVIEAASDYASYSCYKEAIDLLDRIEPEGPMIHYLLAYYYFRIGDLAASWKELKTAAESDPSYCFPNRIEDIAVLNLRSNKIQLTVMPIIISEICFTIKNNIEKLCLLGKVNGIE
jgi:tetratricopeptide (TPR) repeat protein